MCGAEIHHHENENGEKVISKKWKWATVLGNAAIGAAEVATGGLNTMSVTADGIHNGGDAITYHMQAENLLDPEMTDEKLRKRRKIAHFVIAASSALIASKAGMDLAMDHESAHHAYATYAAGASLALNGILFARLRSGIKRTGTITNPEKRRSVNDLRKHFLAVDLPSAAIAAAGATAQKYNVDAEQVGAIASGLIGAWAFRPTEKNLNHGH